MQSVSDALTMLPEHAGMHGSLTSAIGIAMGSDQSQLRFQLTELRLGRSIVTSGRECDSP